MKKVTDGLDKVLEAKAHFDKREEKKSYAKKIISLKETLTDVMFHGEGEQKTEAYQSVMKLNRMQTEHELSTQDKRVIDEMVKKYKV